MKISVLFFVLLALTACDPPADLYDMGMITIDSQVVNPRSAIRLGDSVAFNFMIKDSVLLDNKRIAVQVGNQDGGSIGFYVNKINPRDNTGFDINTVLCKTYANPGEITSNNALSFALKNKGLASKLYFIPKAKGVYFFNQASEGYFDLNNQKLRVRGTINFGNIDRHIQLLVDSAGAGSSIDRYLQSQRSLGREIYGFRVM